MKWPKPLLHWIAQRERLPVVGAITFTLPKTFLGGIYRHNVGNPQAFSRPTLTLSFDCDYPRDVEAIPALLDLLKRYPLKASFACVGHWIEKYPKEHSMILEAGHEIMNHTYSHPDNEIINPGRKFRYISKDEKKEEVERCHEICSRVLGYQPRGLRVPHFKHLFTPDIYNVLKEVGYEYSSSTWLTNTRTFGLPFVAEEGIVEFPLSVCPAHPFTVFDTWHSLNAPRWSHRILHRGPNQYCKLFMDLLRMGEETGSYLNIYMDPCDVPQIPGFPKILDSVFERNRFRLATYEELVNEVRKQPNGSKHE